MDEPVSSVPRPIELEFAAHAVIELGPIRTVGPVLTGQRRVIPIIGGRIDGPLLAATVIAGGADWQLVAADGTLIIDTRYEAITDDGHHVYLATNGFRHGPPEVLARLAAGEPVGPDEYTFRLTASIECGAPALDWVNRTVFVATAARQAASVVYDLYAVR